MAQAICKTDIFFFSDGVAKRRQNDQLASVIFDVCLGWSIQGLIP
jgi:hypothetical protein